MDRLLNWCFIIHSHFCHIIVFDGIFFDLISCWEVYKIKFFLSQYDCPHLHLVNTNRYLYSKNRTNSVVPHRLILSFTIFLSTLSVLTLSYRSLYDLFKFPAFQTMRINIRFKNIYLSKFVFLSRWWCYLDIIILFEMNKNRKTISKTIVKIQKKVFESVH